MIDERVPADANADADRADAGLAETNADADPSTAAEPVTTNCM